MKLRHRAPCLSRHRGRDRGAFTKRFHHRNLSTAMRVDSVGCPQSIALPEASALEIEEEEEDYSVHRCGMMCEPNCSCGISYYCNCSIKYKVVLLTANDMNDPISRVPIFSSEI
ncbi:hypothetical protein PanWU01x14_336250 [Parasponia andersonii]|uniref:Uncharacterized protein n=1 Tax=Parasponia andersonii TaxID=3476 RepID=A0A2P5AG08_PARAD|nr:hypothetical protein PanWU01x14_336250 [Parasponia andersonii]